jgi:hypothetical protein
MSDIDKMFAEHGMKPYEITIREGKITYLRYRNRFLSKKDKAFLESIKSFLDSLGPPEPHSEEEIRQHQEFVGAWLQNRVKRRKQKP